MDLDKPIQFTSLNSKRKFHGGVENQSWFLAFSWVEAMTSYAQIFWGLFSLKLTANAPENRPTPKRKVSKPQFFRSKVRVLGRVYPLPFLRTVNPKVTQRKSLSQAPAAVFSSSIRISCSEVQALTKAEIWSSSGATCFGDTFFGFPKQDFPNRRHNLAVYIVKRKHPKMTSELNRTSSSLEKLGVKVKH